MFKLSTQTSFFNLRVMEPTALRDFHLDVLLAYSLSISKNY